MLYTLRFISLQSAICFIMLTCLFPVLFTFYIQSVLKLKRNNSGAKGLMYENDPLNLCISFPTSSATFIDIRNVMTNRLQRPPPPHTHTHTLRNVCVSRAETL